MYLVKNKNTLYIMINTLFMRQISFPNSFTLVLCIVLCSIIHIFICQNSKIVVFLYML